MHDDLVNAAKRAIERLFSDTSVDKEETRRSLEDLQGYIDILVESLESDMEGG